MEVFSYILPSMLKSWSPNTDSDGQGTVADSSTKKEGVVGGVAVSGVAENKATECNGATKKGKDAEDGASELRAVEYGASELRAVEDGASEQIDVEVAASEQRDVEDGASEQIDVEDGASEQIDVEDGVSEQIDVEDGASEQIDVEDGASEQIDVEDGVSEQIDVEDGVSEQIDVEDGASEQIDVEDGVSEQIDVEDGASEQIDVEDGASEQIDVEDGASELRAVEDGASEQIDVEDGASELRAVEYGASEEIDVEDGASELRDVEDGASELRAVEDGALEQIDVEDGASELRAVDDGASEQIDVEDGASEQIDVEDGASELRDIEDGASELRAVDDGASEQIDVEDGASEQIDVEDGASELRAVEDGASEQRDVEDEIAEQGDVEDRASEQEYVVDEIVEREDVEDGASELRYFEDEIAEREDAENTTCEKCTQCKNIADEPSIHEKATKEPVHKIGHLICKRVTDKNGTKTRKGQRAWKPIKAVLQGMILYLQKDTNGLSRTDIAIEVHHSLAYSIDYKKRPHVLCLKTADLRLFYFQAESEEAQASWIVTLNSIAGYMCAEGNKKKLEDVADKTAECTKAAVEEETMSMEPIHKIGFVKCKKVSEANESKTRKSQRSWKPFNAVLQGMTLYLKTDTANMTKPVNAISVHHSLAYHIDYKKRQHVLCLRTADRRHFFFQAECNEEQASWISTINCIAACYSAPPHIPISHDRMAHCPQFLPSFRTNLSLEQQLECYTYQLLNVSTHLAYYNSLPVKEGNTSVGYMLQDVKRYETYVKELQKLLGPKYARVSAANIYKQNDNLQLLM